MHPKLEAGNTGSDIQSRLDLEAERLKGDGFVEAPNQHVCAQSDTYCHLSGHTAIATGQPAKFLDRL